MSSSENRLDRDSLRVKPSARFRVDADRLGVALFKTRGLFRSPWKNRFLIVRKGFIHVFQTDKPACVEVIDRNDVIISGWLWKLGAIVKNWKRRFFVLTPSTLYYFKTPDDWNTQGIVPLQKATAEPVAHSISEFAFRLQTKHEKASRNSYMFYAEKRETMEDWILAINNTDLIRDELSKKANTRGNEDRVSPGSSSSSGYSSPAEIISVDDSSNPEAEKSILASSLDLEISPLAVETAVESALSGLQLPDDTSYDPWGPDFTVDLRGCSIIENDDGTPSDTFGFQINSADGKSSFWFAVTSDDERKAWIHSLRSSESDE